MVIGHVGITFSSFMEICTMNPSSKIVSFLFVLVAILLISAGAFAHSATWCGQGDTAYWEDPENWCPYGVPDDKATFSNLTEKDPFICSGVIAVRSILYILAIRYRCSIVLPMFTITHAKNLIELNVS